MPNLKKWLSSNFKLCTDWRSTVLQPAISWKVRIKNYHTYTIRIKTFKFMRPVDLGSINIPRISLLKGKKKASEKLPLPNQICLLGSIFSPLNKIYPHIPSCSYHSMVGSTWPVPETFGWDQAYPVTSMQYDMWCIIYK